ncbi:MAG: RHS repeat-associated core domain-containing protein, partial [Steroidobacteraceae bacterium]
MNASVSTSVPYDTGSTYLLVDQDGDALTDVARRTTSTAALAFHRHNAAGTPPGYVGSVSSEGPGPTFQVQYKSIVQGNYAPTEASIPAIAYPQVQFTAPMYVVSRLMMAAGETTKDYFYWSARRDLQGRSFQGFARRRVLDNRSGMYFYEDYKDTFPYTGQVWLQRLFQSDNTTLVYLHQNVWSEWTLDSNPVNKRVFPFISAYLQKRYEVGGPNNGTFVSHRTVGQVMDAWGSLLQLSITNFEQATGLNPGAVYTEIYNYPTITNDTVNWCLNRPTQLLHKASTNLPGGSEIIRTTNYAWDYAKCRLTSEVTEPANAQWQVTRDLEYDTVGNVKKVTLTPASGQGQVARSTQVDYGTTGQFPRTVTDPMGAVTQIAWDVAKGVRTSTTDPNGLQTSWTYNNFGRLIRETRPDGTKTERAIIDCDDVPCGYPDVVPQIEARTTLLDAANNVIRSESRFIENSGRIRAIERDRMAGPRSIQRFKYDTWGRIIEETAPYIAGDPSFTTSYTYDALSFPLGELKSQTDAKNKTISFTYDALSRMLTQTMPEGTSGSITSTFTWGTSDAANNIGRLQSMQIAGTGLTTYSEAYLYDSVGRLSQTTYTEGATNYLVNYAYDANHGLLSQVTYPTSTSGFRLPIQYEYQHGFLSRVFDSSNQFWVANALDAANHVTSATLGEVTNGVTFQTLSDYDRVTGLLESRTSTFNSGAVSGTSIANLGYVYDAVGNVIQRQDNQQGLTENFYYDALDRLDYSTLGGVTTDYNYDNRGNLTAKTGVGTLYSYTANVAGCTYYAYAQPHAVRQITGGPSTMNFCYDQNGNMTNRNGTALTWFADNLPKTITKDANNSSTFQYGPNGQRWRHVYRTGGSTYTHTYIGNLLEKVVGPTTTDWKHYIYANGERVAMYIRKSNSAKDRYFFTTDRLGSVAALSHSDGAWVLRESFDAFGQRRAPTTWTGAPSAGDLTQMNDKSRRGFTMHEHLDSTGLIHMNGRVFDPQIARFASADPFVQNPYNLQSLNRYSYV